MSATCPVPTDEQRKAAAIHARAIERLNRDLDAALRATVDATRAELRAAAIDHDPEGFLTATLLQRIFCKLCGADPDTFEGGNPATAVPVIENCMNIARHHWHADIPRSLRPLPDPAPP